MTKHTTKVQLIGQFCKLQFMNLHSLWTYWWSAYSLHCLFDRDTVKQGEIGYFSNELKRIWWGLLQFKMPSWLECISYALCRFRVWPRVSIFWSISYRLEVWVINPRFLKLKESQLSWIILGKRESWGGQWIKLFQCVQLGSKQDGMVECYLCWIQIPPLCGRQNRACICRFDHISK